jgi:hypothetical protein
MKYKPLIGLTPLSWIGFPLGDVTPFMLIHSYDGIKPVDQIILSTTCVQLSSNITTFPSAFITLGLIIIRLSEINFFRSDPKIGSLCF